MKRFRYMIGARAVGPIRDTRREAVEDAIADGMAERDPMYRNQVFITVPAWIAHVSRA